MRTVPVSYTHLDVYKRQILDSHGKRNITQAQLSYMLEDIYYDYRIKTTHYKR